MSDHHEPPAVAFYDWDVPGRQFMAEYYPGQKFYSLSFPNLTFNLMSQSLNEVRKYFRDDCLGFLAMHWQREKNRLKKIFLFLEQTIVEDDRMILSDCCHFFRHIVNEYRIIPEIIKYRRAGNCFAFETGRTLGGKIDEVIFPALNPKKIIIGCCDPRMNIIMSESNDFTTSVPGTVYMVTENFFTRQLVNLLRKAIKTHGTSELILIYHTPDCAAHMGYYGFDHQSIDFERTIQQSKNKLRIAVGVFKEKMRSLPNLRIVGQCINIARREKFPAIVTWSEMNEHGKLLPLDHLTREVAL